MRSFLLGFLMLVMLTPSLACAMPVCAFMSGQSKAGQETSALSPCHGDVEAGDKKADSLMFLKDCAGFDLAKVDHDAVKKPDVQVEKISFAWADIAPAYSFTPADAYQIRGPPPIETVGADSHSSIYMTTQRLRI